MVGFNPFNTAAKISQRGGFFCLEGPVLVQPYCFWTVWIIRHKTWLMFQSCLFFCIFLLKWAILHYIDNGLAVSLLRRMLVQFCAIHSKVSLSKSRNIDFWCYILGVHALKWLCCLVSRWRAAKSSLPSLNAEWKCKALWIFQLTLKKYCIYCLKK